MTPQGQREASQSLAVQRLCEKWLLDCLTRHAVRIEPSLRAPSPENGNISACDQRRSAISPRGWRNREPGDRSPNSKSTLLAGISPATRDDFPECRTGWLER